MKISNSKKELARIISVNGGWRDGAEWSIQDSDKSIEFMTRRPEYMKSVGAWYAYASRIGSFKIDNLLPNFHQTILSRAEYLHLYPAQDADGWIEWKGEVCPVKRGTLVDVRFSGGSENIGVSAMTEGWHEDHVKGSNENLVAMNWSSGLLIGVITAYRLHKQANPEFCESVMRSIPEPTAKPTIEQLAADYRNAKDYAERKQQEADDAKADADERLKALKLAGKEHGLLVSPITEKQEPGLVIAVQVGDEVECIKSNVNPGKYMGRIGTVSSVDVDDTSTPYLVDFGGKAKVWCHEVKFIRRP